MLDVLDSLRTHGYATFPLSEPSALEAMQASFLDVCSKYSSAPIASLSEVHRAIEPARLNELRLDAIRQLNGDVDFRNSLLTQVSPQLEACFGPDIAAQKTIGLVISMPGDATSQIPLHSDTWTGHSPFELNLWVPFTRTVRTQSMFLLPLSRLRDRPIEGMKSGATIQDLMSRHESDFKYIEMEPGQALLFWHHLPHGNTVNREESTRWSLNMRFKNLFTPYGEKGLGDYFVPWKKGPFTETVLRYGGIWS
ncbi:MAG: sporadic carbohydrate cluster 2OG-Fe(II) oxygenase [Bdellovibrionota bacterium]